jgi:hypothetical protein
MSFDPNELCGWLDRPEQVEAFLGQLPKPTYADAAGHLTGTGASKVVLLYEAARKVMGQDLDTGPQKIGDCVSWGWSGCTDLVACLDALAGQNEAYSWGNRVCTEAIYGLSRVEYGDFDGSYQDGSVGAWAAQAVTKGGTLGRELLGQYDPKRAKEWGAKGLPHDLEVAAAQHRVVSVVQVKDFQQARDLIANGYPIAVCSNVGFETGNGSPALTRRDSKGFSKPHGRWNHCMKFVASRDDERPGLLCYQSWGNASADGPKGDYDIPNASWWVDADVCEKMLKQGDSFALSQFDGYPAQTEVINWLV